MSDEYKSPLFRKWLDTLQQESWQLELIISGFALYALFSAYDPVAQAANRAVALENSFQAYLYTFLVSSLFILMLNLTVHVILRGLWIGAIGLRYVSGEIDYDEFRYSLNFQRHLENKVGSFDRFIANLEKYCSVIFAVTFLMIFYILGVFILFGLMFLASMVIQATDNSFLRNFLIIAAWLTIGLGIFLTLIDFITQGWLKRNKWLSKVYFPYYRLFIYLTLSIIYRPLVYNLLDNRFGRRLVRILVPVYVTVLIILSIETVNSNYVPPDFEDPFFKLEFFESIAPPVNYEDELGEEKFAKIISIPSKIIESNHLKVFIPYRENIEETLFTYCPELKPSDDRRGIRFTIFKTIGGSVDQRREQLNAYLACVADNYQLDLDGEKMPAGFIVSQNIKEQHGFETVISLGSLGEGKHLLTLVRTGTEGPVVLARVPFWYYPG